MSYFTNFILSIKVKAFLRGDAPPFTATQLEGMGVLVSMNVKVARKLSNNSLRYWMIEYMRRQKGKRFSALVIRFIKDRTAAILVLEVIMFYFKIKFALF